MPIMDLLSEDCISLDLRATSKLGVLAELVDILDGAGKLKDREGFLQAVLAREATGSTGLEQGVAIPHARSDSVREAGIAFGVARAGVDFAALDGQPSHFFMLIAEPEDVDSRHLDILASASCHLIDADFRRRLIEAATAADVVRLFAGDEPVAPPPEGEGRSVVLVAAVTSCPAGISHTYMAADCLRKTARRMGIDIKVETHGAVGVMDRLSSADIERAEAVVLAVGRKISKDRFAGKRVIEVRVADAIRNPEKLLVRALEGKGSIQDDAGEHAETWGAGYRVSDLYRHLMNGVSNVLPFVIAGGILISLSSRFGVDSTSLGPADHHAWVAWLMRLGGPDGAFGLMVPVLAGFIGRSIADRPGFMPAMVGGFIMAQAGAGFIGGMLAGLAGGYGVQLAKHICRVLPQRLVAIRDILIYPFLGLLCVGGFVFLLIEPVVVLNHGLAQWLRGLELGGRILLGALLGGLMAADMGGPINKAAFTFGIIAIETGNYLPQAAVMAGGMVPPLALGIASMLFASRFNETERHSGTACLLMGACFITEGAMPYAAADPRRVIPSCVLGASAAGALSMAFGCELLVPHGGVFVIPLVRHWPEYLLAISSGALLAACLVGMLKRPQPR